MIDPQTTMRPGLMATEIVGDGGWVDLAEPIMVGAGNAFIAVPEEEKGQTMTWIDWYNSLAKPTWTPAPATISLIWMILYPIILVSFGFIFFQAFRGKVGWKVAVPFAVNLVANLLFMPIFAGLKNVPLACIDILIVWVTILWCVIVVWPHNRWVAVAQVPYLVWVSIATVLQMAITWANR